MSEPTIVRLERETAVNGMTIRYIVEVQWSPSAVTARENAVDAMRALVGIDDEAETRGVDLHAEYRRRQS